MLRSKSIHRTAAITAALLAGTLSTTHAWALLNAGVEAGVVKRTASSPHNMNLGFGYGAHGELTFDSTFALGVYYLRSTNSITGVPSDFGAKATFDTLGVRGRLILPMPGKTKPYASVGLGHNWTTYSSNANSDLKGQSWEVPIGFGIAHQILRIFQLTLEAAYRPSFSFSGNAYDVARIRNPSSGWSALIGFALDL